MIIVPDAVVLAAAATATPFTNSRICIENFCLGLDANSVTVSGETTDGPRDAPLRPNTFEFWQADALPATYIVDLGQARTFDYIALLAERSGYKVETSTNSIDWTIFGSEVYPADDAPLVFFDSSRVARFVRFTVNGDVAPRVSVIYIGRQLAMQRSIYGGHAPLTLSRDTVLQTTMSRGGQFLGHGFRRMGLVGGASFRFLTPSWYRTYFDPFVKLARRYPYFFVWRPLTYPLEVGFVWTDTDIKPSNMGKRDFMQVNWPMRGIGWE